MHCALKILRDLGIVAITTYICVKIYVKYHLDRFRLVGKVAELAIYPVVSCGDLQVSSAQGSAHGLEAYGALDKALVVCARNLYPHPLMAYGEFRQIPLDAWDQPEVEYTAEQFNLKSSQREHFRFTAPDNTLEKKEVRVQLVCGKDIYTGYKTDPSFGRWFQALVACQDDVKVIRRLACVWNKRESRTALGKVVILNGEAVLEAAKEVEKSREDKLIEARQVLRPNVIISGCRPSKNVTWSHVAIGGHFVGKVTGPNIRVLGPIHNDDSQTFDDTDMRDHGEVGEEFPQGQFVCGLNQDMSLGVNVKVEQAGEVSVGDMVYARFKRPATVLECLLEFYHTLAGGDVRYSTKLRYNQPQASVARKSQFSVPGTSGKVFVNPPGQKSTNR